MAIKSISNIANVRNFLDFDSLTELQKKVVIYASNGMGKTNLSRLVHYLKHPELDINDLKSDEAGEEEISFKLTIDGLEVNENNYRDESSQTHLSNILIFNCDFVDENINCEDFTKKNTDGVIQIELGKEDAELKAAQQEYDRLIVDRKSAYDSLQDNLDLIKPRLIVEEKKYLNNELNIWKELDLSRIISATFISVHDHIDFIKSEPQLAAYLTCEADLQETKGIDESDKLTFNQNSPLKLDVDAIKTLLAESVTLPVIDEQTEANLKFLQGWLSHDLLAHGKTAQNVIEKGIKLSENPEVNKCILCKRALDQDATALFKSYKEYFEGQKAKYESKVNGMIRTLNDLDTELSGITDSLKVKAEKYIGIFGLKLSWSEIETEAAQKEVARIKDLLEAKLVNPSRTLALENKLSSMLSAISANVAKNKDICEKLNKKIEKSYERSTELRTTVGQKYLYEFITNHEEQIAGIAEFNSKIADSKLNIQAKEKASPKKEARTHIKDLFNLFLNQKIGITKYEADIVNDQIVIKLNNYNISEKTNKISEGEKTMLGLCYFFASSILTLNDPARLGTSVFLVDDPVSSTSYGNFFGICSLIQSFEYDIRLEVWPKETKDLIVQKIVLTHNIQFFNMLRNHVFKTASNTSYLLLQSKTFNVMKPGALLSEFQTSLYRVYKKSQDTNYDTNVGNDMRRILETMRHFYGFSGFDKETVPMIFPYTKSSGYEAFFQLVNYYSHGNAEENLDPLPPDIIDAGVIQFVEIIGHDESPFKDLWISVAKMEEVS